MMRTLGQILDKEQEARKIETSVIRQFEALPTSGVIPTVLYLIWKDPFMAAGRLTFINDMILRAGFTNVIRDKTSRYPVLTDLEIQELNPDYIWLSSEPFPFAGKHLAEIENKFPNKPVMLVDGEMFSWYGSRLSFAASYFQELRTRIIGTNE